MTGSSWSGRTVLVTGASRGVGRALAIELGRRGALVACAARATDERQFKLPGTVDETARQVTAAGGEGLAVPTDLSRPEDVAAMVETTVRHFGRLDALVNNAAVSFPGDLEIAPKRFDLMMAINVRAPLLATTAARPHLVQSGNGRILHVSSAAANHYHPTMLGYGMSKVALEHLTTSTAEIVAGEPIAVNCFRIDVPVASEGYVMNAPDADHSRWAATEVAAEGIVWMLDQPLAYTGRVEAMRALGERESIMAAIPALA